MLAADLVGERSGGAPTSDLRLRALRLQIAENACELGDLSLVEVELVGQKPQWPAHAKGPGPEVALMMSRRVHGTPTFATRVPPIGVFR